MLLWILMDFQPGTPCNRRCADQVIDKSLLISGFTVNTLIWVMTPLFAGS